MSEQTGLEQTPQNQSQPSTSTVSQASGEADRIKTAHIFIAICCIGIIVCFFLPLITLFLGTASAYQLQQLPSDQVKLLWFIPGAATLPLFALLVKQGVAPMAGIAGITPFVALVYYVAKYGTDLFQALQIGAYLTLILGGILCVLPLLLKKSKP